MIRERVRATEKAQKAMAFGLEDLDEDELDQFKEHQKVRVFFQGINALLVGLTLIIGTVEVAENLESQY